jgi:hypothetical protein
MITAKDLLYKALDYDNFWHSTERLKKSDAGKARKAQLDSLLAAFNISKKNINSAANKPYVMDKHQYAENFYSVSGRSKTMNRFEYIKSIDNIRYFTTGEFIADIGITHYNKISKRILKKVIRIFPDYKAPIVDDRINLVLLFSKLFNYRHSIHFMLNVALRESITKDTAIEECYSIHLEKRAREKINTNLKEIDSLLCFLIDPKKAFPVITWYILIFSKKL